MHADRMVKAGIPYPKSKIQKDVPRLTSEKTGGNYCDVLIASKFSDFLAAVCAICNDDCFLIRLIQGFKFFSDEGIVTVRIYIVRIIRDDGTILVHCLCKICSIPAMRLPGFESVCCIRIRRILQRR